MVAAWLILNASGISPARQRVLLQAFGDPQSLLAAADSELTAVEGITAVHVGKLRRAEAETDTTAVQERMAELGISVVALADPHYPALLRESADPPAVLFVQGSLDKRDGLSVGIVGTRKCTPYGRKATRQIAAALARRGFTVVSGMAMGIDAEAHDATLEAGGRTIAVMATGPDITYPAEHKKLRERIAAQGAVITENPFGAPPTRERFPIRNRIIAGLSLGTLVVEAPVKSGALITARVSAEYGRDVFAIPGSIDSPVSRGCHELIKDGCRLVEVAEDIVEGLGIMLAAVPATPPQPAVAVSGDEKTVLAALDHQPRHVDSIVAEINMDIARVNAVLMMLEMKGLTRRFPGNTYVRIPGPV